MNSVVETIHNRYSCRHFDDKKIELELLQELVKAGMAAPTGKDRRPWRFVIVDDRQLLDTMGEALPYAKMLKNAPAAIVVCGIEEEELGGSPYWYVDCSAATQNILLAATSMGLGTVWTAAYPYKERIQPVQQILNLESHVTPLCVIPIGYPSRDPRVRDKFEIDKIQINNR